MGKKKIQWAKSWAYEQKQDMRLLVWTTLQDKREVQVAKYDEAVNPEAAREESYHTFFGEVSSA